MELSLLKFDYEINLDKQRDLFIDCFPETAGDSIQGKEHYLWKFHSFPSNNHSWEFASTIENELVGYYAALPYKYKVGNKITEAGMVCDVMTSSKFRGKGIFTKMGNYSTNELSSVVPFTMGYPIRKEVIGGHLKVGWKIPFNMPLYIKFIRMNALLKTRKISFIAPLANALIFIYNYFVKTKLNKKYTFTITTNICEVQGYDEFVKEWSSNISNTLIKDLSFARWRYSAPNRSYQFLSIKSIEGKMIAFISFCKTVKVGVPSYGIIDYMVLPGFEDCHGKVNKILIDCAKSDKVEAILTMMSKTSVSKYKLLKNGFIRSPLLFHLIIKNLTHEFTDEQLFNENNWHLMWVDSDVL